MSFGGLLCEQELLLQISWATAELHRVHKTRCEGADEIQTSSSKQQLQHSQEMYGREKIYNNASLNEEVILVSA